MIKLKRPYPIKIKKMFGLFKKKSEKERLQKKYEKLLKEAYELSKTNRKEGDKKTYEADLIAKKIEGLD
tara:strand:+ start:513 stop:719 length:207 start_codon:yes stop_codon:yes gene_type:complete